MVFVSLNFFFSGHLETILHVRLWIRILSSLVQLDISLVHSADS